MAEKNQRGALRVAVDPSLLDWAEYWYPISWKGVLAGGVITAIGACATIAFLLLQWRTTSIREEQSDWRTSVLEADTARAKADLGAAQADIAKAHAEIAKAQARTAEAELALQKLKNPRHLKPEQMQRLIADLRKHAGKKFCVTVGRIHADPFAEQTVFANELTSAFISAGWTRTARVSVDPNRVEPETVAPDQRGCGLSSAPDGASLAVRGYVARALSDVGVECDTRTWEGMLPEVLCLDIGFW